MYWNWQLGLQQRRRLKSRQIDHLAFGWGLKACEGGLTVLALDLTGSGMVKVEEVFAKNPPAEG